MIVASARETHRGVERAPRDRHSGEGAGCRACARSAPAGRARGSRNQPAEAPPASEDDDHYGDGRSWCLLVSEGRSATIRTTAQACMSAGEDAQAGESAGRTRRQDVGGARSRAMRGRVGDVVAGLDDQRRRARASWCSAASGALARVRVPGAPPAAERRGAGLSATRADGRGIRIGLDQGKQALANGLGRRRPVVARAHDLGDQPLGLNLLGDLAQRPRAAPRVRCGRSR
jgi:hypothetical protein